MADEAKDAIERTYGQVESRLEGGEAPDPEEFVKYIEQSFHVLNEDKSTQTSENLRQHAKFMMDYWSREINRYTIEVPPEKAGARLYTVAPFKPVSESKVEKVIVPEDELEAGENPPKSLVIDRKTGDQLERVDLYSKGPDGWDCHIEVNIPQTGKEEIIHTIDIVNGQITKWERYGQKVSVALNVEEMTG